MRPQTPQPRHRHAVPSVALTVASSRRRVDRCMARRPAARLFSRHGIWRRLNGRWCRTRRWSAASRCRVDRRAARHPAARLFFARHGVWRRCNGRCCRARRRNARRCDGHDAGVRGQSGPGLPTASCSGAVSYARHSGRETSEGRNQRRAERLTGRPDEWRGTAAGGTIANKTGTVTGGTIA